MPSNPREQKIHINRHNNEKKRKKECPIHVGGKFYIDHLNSNKFRETNWLKNQQTIK